MQNAVAGAASCTKKAERSARRPGHHTLQDLRGLSCMQNHLEVKFGGQRSKLQGHLHMSSFCCPFYAHHSCSKKSHNYTTGPDTEVIHLSSAAGLRDKDEDMKNQCTITEQECLVTFARFTCVPCMKLAGNSCAAWLSFSIPSPGQVGLCIPGPPQLLLIRCRGNRLIGMLE